MTSPDFAELKEKLTTFDSKKNFDEIMVESLDKNPDRNSKDLVLIMYVGARNAGRNEQNSKSAAIITELLEIISLQDNKISELLNYLHHNEDNLVGDDLIGDQRFTKRFNNYTKSTSDVLSETTTRLQKLREGK